VAVGWPKNLSELGNDIRFGLAERRSSAILSRFDWAAGRWPVYIFGLTKQEFKERCLGKVYF
jgi:hypothetical protein